MPERVKNLIPIYLLIQLPVARYMRDESGFIVT